MAVCRLALVEVSHCGGFNRWLWDRIMRCEKEKTLNGHLLMIHFGTDERRIEKFYDRLPALIKELKKRGYSFVPLTTLLSSQQP